VAVFAREGPRLFVALIQRRHEPFEGAWALPGGFIEMDEKLVESAKRELLEETGIRAKWLAPAGFAGDPGRDPRGRTVSAVFYTLLEGKPDAQAGDDAAALQWFLLNDPTVESPALAFDHSDVLDAVLVQLEKDALTTGLVFQSLPVPFHEDDFADACTALPGLASLAPQARMILTALRSRGLVSEIDTPPTEPRLCRWNRKTWGEKPRPWTTWFHL
jgi:8-oxo-dGTP diphosphatase